MRKVGVKKKIGARALFPVTRNERKEVSDPDFPRKEIPGGERTKPRGTLHAGCSGMKRPMSEMNFEPDFELEEECATWDWARTAGITAQQLREALRELLVPQESA